MIDKKDKIILIFLQSGVGGAERMTVLIARILSQAGFIPHLVVLSTTNDSESRIQGFIPDSFYITKIHYNGRIELLNKLFHEIRSINPVICFSSVININNKILILRRLFPKIRFIIRCDNYMFSYSGYQRFLIRLTYKRADSIIAQTKEMGEELIRRAKVNPQKVVVLQNPIDTISISQKLLNAQSPFISDHRYHVVSVGRFAYQKGYDILTKAISLLIKSGLPVDLYIIGAVSGKNEKEYLRVKQIAQDENVDSCIHFLGYKENPYPFMRYADCYVLSSRWEGLPNALIEALYLGTPVAAVNCIPIISRIIQDGVNGYLAEMDSIDSLANAIYKTLSLGRIESHYASSTPEEVVSVFVRSLE